MTFFNKKAFLGPGGVGGPRQPISGILGLVFLILGVVPLLNSFGIIGFALPAVPDFIARIILLIAGTLLLWDAKHEIFNNRAWMWLSLVLGIPILVLGLVPVLNSFGVIDFTLNFVPILVYNILTAVAGVILFIDAWKAE